MGWVTSVCVITMVLMYPVQVASLEQDSTVMVVVYTAFALALVSVLVSEFVPVADPELEPEPEIEIEPALDPVLDSKPELEPEFVTEVVPEVVPPGTAFSPEEPDLDPLDSS